MKRHLSRFWTFVLVVTGLSAIALAALFTFGRLYLSQIDNHRAQIDGWLSEQLGVEVTTSSLSGRWTGLAPELTIRGVLIRSRGEQAEALLGAGTLIGRPDILRSLVTGQPVWKYLEAQNVGVVLRENEGGQWQIPGFVQTGSGETNLWQIFTQSRNIKIGSIRAHLTSFSGVQLDVVFPNGEIENLSDFHRVRLDAYLNKPENRANLVLEIHGSPASLDELTGSGYLDFDADDLDRSVSAFLRRYLAEDIPLLDTAQAAVNASVWMNLEQQMQLEFSGSIEMERIPLNWFSENLKSAGFRADISGHVDYPGAMRVDLHDAQATWDDVQFPSMDISLLKGFGEDWRELDLYIPNANLSEINQAVLGADFLPGRAQEVLEALQPSGQLQNLSLAIELGQQPLGFVMQANLVDVAMDNYRNAPQVSSLDGFIRATSTGGVVELDGSPLNIRYPSVYDEPFQHQAVSGVVEWGIDPDTRRYTVLSGPLKIIDPAGLMQGQFRYDGPIKDDGFGSEMVLYLGAEDLKAEDWDAVTPDSLNANTRSWLERAIQGGTVEQAALIYRGSVRRGETAYRTVQLKLNAVNGELAFTPGWPEVTDVKSRVVVSDGEVRVAAETGELSGLRLSNGSVRVAAAENGERRVWVDVDAEGSAQSALGVLTQTPIRNQVGQTFDRWTAEGTIRSNVSLSLPISGLEEADQLHTDIVIVPQNIALQMPEFNLSLDEVAGEIVYGNNGLNSDELSGVLWGKPIAIDIRQQARREGIVVQGSGQIAIEDLSAWLGGDYLNFLSGVTHADLRIDIPPGSSEEEIRIEVASNLIGVASDIPYPLDKDTESTRQTVVEYFPQTAEPELRFSAGEFSGALRFAADGKLSAASFGHGSPGIPELSAGELQGSLQSDWLDLGAHSDYWSGRWNKDSETSGQIADSSTGDSTIADAGLFGLMPLIQIVSEETGFRDSRFGPSSILISKFEGDWSFEFQNELVDGQLLLDSAGEDVPILKLSELRLPGNETTPADTGVYEVVDGSIITEDFGPPEDSPLSSVDPRLIPRIDVQIDRILRGDMEMGSWAFNLTPTEFGLSVDQIVGTIAEASVELDDELNNLVWFFDNENHQTLLNLNLNTGDLGDLLAAVGSQPLLTSETGEMYGNFVWEGAPDQFNRGNLSGILGVTLNNGEYLQSVEGAGGAILRLVSLFNINTWARRLQFDFKDLTSSGTAFNSLSADLLIQGRQISTLSPVNIELSSGRMLFRGDFDLEANMVNAQIVATLPVRQNMTWVAALLGGLPVAAGVWVAGQIFGDQLDNLASVSYQISGSIDEPDIKVERVFDSIIK